MVATFKEQYELYLEWTTLEYVTGAIKFNKSLLYGPALKNAQRIQENDNMKLDFSAQNFIVIPDPSFNVATLKWQGVNYLRDDVVELKDCVLEYTNIGLLKNLTPDNFFIVDCERHEERVHAKYLTYIAWVLDNDGNPIGIE